jgi:hypothetical protein
MMMELLSYVLGNGRVLQSIGILVVFILVFAAVFLFLRKNGPKIKNIVSQLFLPDTVNPIPRHVVLSSASTQLLDHPAIVKQLTIPSVTTSIDQPTFDKMMTTFLTNTLPTLKSST